MDHDLHVDCIVVGTEICRALTRAAIDVRDIRCVAGDADFDVVGGVIGADVTVGVEDPLKSLVNGTEGRDSGVVENLGCDPLRSRGDAYRQEQINKATGETTRFLAIYKQYAAAKDITRQRIYITTMQEILAGMDKILVSQGSGGVVPYLPLRELRRGTSNANNNKNNSRERATAGPRR